MAKYRLCGISGSCAAVIRSTCGFTAHGSLTSPMAKYRLCGISGSCAADLFAASRIALDSQTQLLPGAEGHHASRGNGNLFAGFRVAAGPLILVAQLEVAEAGQLHLLARFQARANLLEEQIDKILCLALVQT